MKKPILIIFSLLIFASCSSGSNSEESTADDSTATTETSAAVEKSVYFILPQSGNTVSSPVKITMGVKGMTVEPAGEVNENMGHHHLIIDGDFIPEGEIVPADSTHIHYGKGQTEVEVPLSLGEHRITMQFADGVHASYGEEMSASIEVVVE